MATGAEIMEKWESVSKEKKPSEAIVLFYRMAEKDAIAEMEKELQSESTIEEAIKMFGCGRKSKAGMITVKALMNEAIHIAKSRLV